MQLEWEIAVYPDQVMVLIRGAAGYGDLVREAFPDVPHTDNYPDPAGEYDYAFSLLRAPDLAIKIGYLLRTLAGAQLLSGEFNRGFALDRQISANPVGQLTELGQLLEQCREQRRYGLLEELAYRLARFIRYHPLYQTAELMVPVPDPDRSHPFDLAVRLAELSGSQAHLPVLANALQPVTDRELLDQGERFGCPHAALLHGRAVLILTDRCQTGASLNAAARALAKAGVRACYALALTCD